MKFIPHEYQRYAIEYIKTHPVAAVFLDMGLGKTSITLTAIHDLLFDSFEIRKVLCICPIRVGLNSWPTELEKWSHLKDISYSVAIGSEAERKAALLRQADIYIINRENVTWLVDYYKNAWPFDMVVVDEFSSFKNHSAKRFKSLAAIRPHIRRIVGLTGTPSPNGLEDLWAQVYLLDSGERLGKYFTHFRSRYFDPGRRSRR